MIKHKILCVKMFEIHKITQDIVEKDKKIPKKRGEEEVS